MADNGRSAFTGAAAVVVQPCCLIRYLLCVLCVWDCRIEMCVNGMDGRICHLHPDDSIDSIAVADSSLFEAAKTKTALADETDGHTPHTTHTHANAASTPTHPLHPLLLQTGTDNANRTSDAAAGARGGRSAGPGRLRPFFVAAGCECEGGRRRQRTGLVDIGVGTRYAH